MLGEDNCGEILVIVKQTQSDSVKRLNVITSHQAPYNILSDRHICRLWGYVHG